MTARIFDANINRLSEGLRVIEEYVRFIAQNKDLTTQLSTFRKEINLTELNVEKQLVVRDTSKDMRAGEVPVKRPSINILLKANFKRVQEALRVLEEYTGDSRYNVWRYKAYDLEKLIVLNALKPPIKKGIYLVSSDVDVLLKGVAWGVSLIQLRDKFASKETIFNKAKKIMAKYDGRVPFILNDFLDIAQLLNVDGVHTGQDDIPVNYQRKLLGEHKLIGRTTHTLEQGKLAQEEGADYVSVGPIWDTPSKPDRKGIGFDYLESVAQSLSVPFVCIGGVNHSNIHLVMKHNPTMVGLIRDFESIPQMMKDYF